MFKNIIKSLKNYLHLYSQLELLQLKESLTKELNTKLSRTYTAKEEFNKDECIIMLNVVDTIQNDLEKVKLITSINNVIFGIIFLIYRREKLVKRLDYLTRLSKGKSKENKEFFKDFTITKEKIEKVMSNLKKKITKIDTKITKRNNFIYSIFKPKTNLFKNRT
jgi:hypothetical protein